MHLHLLAYHGIIAWIIIGGLAGAIAKAITPGRDPQGCIITILLGIAGAVVAGWLARRLDLFGPDYRAGFLAAIVGAIIILVIYRAIAGRRF